MLLGIGNMEGVLPLLLIVDAAEAAPILVFDVAKLYQDI